MYKLPVLQYNYNALEPFISEDTLKTHHDKHHALYVDNMNNLIKDTDLEDKKIEDIILNSDWAIFNNAAQAWNHTFYFEQFWLDNRWVPTDNLIKLIEENFKTFTNFKEQFINSCVWNFWSGWTWLVKTPAWKLEIINTSNAGTIITTANTPILVCDVWEHAYYIDVKNLRAKYVENFFQVIDWQKIEDRL